VHQKTVGEHTGVVDKNGKDIYEGDIVRITSNIRDDYNALITFFNGGFCAIDGTEGNHSLRIYRLSNSELEIEVIGNIHENPELLEAKE